MELFEQDQTITKDNFENIIQTTKTVTDGKIQDKIDQFEFELDTSTYGMIRESLGSLISSLNDQHSRLLKDIELQNNLHSHITTKLKNMTSINSVIQKFVAEKTQKINMSRDSLNTFTAIVETLERETKSMKTDADAKLTAIDNKIKTIDTTASHKLRELDKSYNEEMQINADLTEKINLARSTYDEQEKKSSDVENWVQVQVSAILQAEKGVEALEKANNGQNETICQLNAKIELKDTEYASKVGELETKMQSKLKEYNILKEVNKSYQDEYAHLEESYNNTKTASEKLTEQHESYEAEKTSLEETLNGLILEKKNIVDDLNQKTLELENQIKSKQEEVEAMKIKEEAIINELAAKKQEVNRLKLELKNKQEDQYGLDKENAAINDRVLEKNNLIAAIKEKEQEIDAAKSSLNAVLMEFEAVKAHGNQQIESLQSELKNLELDYNGKQNELILSNSRAQELEDENLKVNQENENEIAKLNLSLLEAEKKIERNSAIKNSLGVDLAEKEGILANLNKDYDILRNGRPGPVSREQNNTILKLKKKTPQKKMVTFRTLDSYESDTFSENDSFIQEICHSAPLPSTSKDITFNSIVSAESLQSPSTKDISTTTSNDLTSDN